MKLSFLGAAQSVTGSKYLVTTDSRQVLIDCGLFQGRKELRLRNWEAPPLDIASIDAVVLTHAHIDHSGYIPVLAKRGYKGPVYCTPATFELCRILLPDSGYLQEEEANYANKHRYSKHSPALPLYTQAEAERSLKLFQTVGFDEEFDLGGGVTFHYTRAGHILGSACVHLTHAGKRVVFSGDVGRPEDPVMRAPISIKDADVLIVESTYGDRLHSDSSPSDELSEVIIRTIDRQGIVVIPAFAVGRTQGILHLLSELRAAGKIPKVPTYLNSPMAINATEIYCNHAGEHRLSQSECASMFDVAEMVRSPEASRALNTNDGPGIIISASGMATGGRVVHHLKTLLPDPRNTVMFAGFQAPGTRGAALVDGADEVKIHGQTVPVRAEVVSLDGLSAHADYSEITAWLRSIKSAPRNVFITHGQLGPAEAFQKHIQEQLGWKSEIPDYRDEAEV